SPDLKQMDLLIAREAVQWDVDITAFGRAPGEDAEGQRFLPADPELVERLTRAAPEARLGRIASGDSFLADRERARLIRQVQEADAVEMEGAAALWAARRFGIRLALLRAISDSGDGSAAESFDVFLPRASARLAEVCRRLIDLP
ncbi:MAG: 5'-methylthioadenosine/S-adenosylhomocysteine nucleosidase, partial [Fimbriimonadaceae bacterium]|nr:5'-methylthioadenosine/S-adenosylhomocysteine nucleosidase [Fimbriimonadaceae bacterium]